MSRQATGRLGKLSSELLRARLPNLSPSVLHGKVCTREEKKKKGGGEGRGSGCGWW